MTNPQDLPAPSASSSWRQRSVRIKARLRGGVPFASGLVAALVAVALYGVLRAGPATTEPAGREPERCLGAGLRDSRTCRFTACVQAVAPSLVLVQTQDAGSTLPRAARPGGAAAPGSTAAPSGIPAADGTLGSGVVVDASGDILTCLHVVADATSIQVTFADGTKSPATISGHAAAGRHRRPAGDPAAGQARAGRAGQSPERAGRQRGLRRRQPVRPVRLASAPASSPA